MSAELLIAIVAGAAVLFGLGVLIVREARAQHARAKWKKRLHTATVAVPPVAVAASALGVVVLLAVIARADDGNEARWAEGIAAVSLLVVSFLLYATGRAELTVTTRFEAPGYPVGTQLDEERYNQLTDADKARVLTQTEYDALPPAEKQQTDPWTVKEAIDKTEYVVGRRLTQTDYDTLNEEQKGNVRRQRGAYFRMLYVGQDGRWSTSKLQALLWTYAILFAFISLFVADQLGLRIEGEGDTIGFGNLDFRDEYLILLGGPFAAAVLAKGLTTSKVENGNLVKVETPTERDVVTGFRDVISDDAGRADLVDFQYFMFGLVALVFFAVRLVPNLEDGFPDLPAFLAGLTSVSALAYVTKKAVESSTPQITAVVPSTALPRQVVEVRGRFLAPAGSEPDVLVDGREAHVTVRETAIDGGTRLGVTLPEALAAGEKTLVVAPAGPNATAESKITIVVPMVTGTNPIKVPGAEDSTFVVTGSGFGVEAGTVELESVVAEVVDWAEDSITVKLTGAVAPGAGKQLIVTRTVGDRVYKPTRSVEVV
jgi:hypothetical protein